MKTARKNFRKILVAMMALVMLFGTCMTVSATGTSNPVAAIKSITAKNTTVYTNDGVTEIPVSYKWDNKKGNQDYSAPVGVTADSSNKGVVKVVGFEGKTDSISGKTTTTTTTLKLEAVANGKAKITITDKVNPKKKKVITVTVKTWANDIAFNGNTVSEDDTTVTIANVKGATVNLGAVVTNDASNKGIKYAVDTADKRNGISVDSKGNVKVTAKNGEAKDATLVVTSKDGKVTKNIEVKVATAAVDALTLVQDSNQNVNTPGMLNKKNVLNMKGNKASDAYTYQLDWKEDIAASDLVFTTNKASVATVDANGKITAKGNGTAKITVSPKLGNKVSKSITVKVTTDVEDVTVAAESFTILANNKASANIAAKTNANASKKTVKYTLISVQEQGKDELITKSSDMKKIVSLSNKGVVKMKKAATAKILVQATADPEVARTVTVTGTTPVTSVALDVTADSNAVANTKKTSFVMYRTSATEAQKLALVATVNDDASNKAIKWSSNKPAVADVVDGEIIAKANGKATITALAADGSGKKKTVTVTVKTDAYEITSVKAQAGTLGETVYVEGKTDKATNYAFNKFIAAKTNADASNKAVKYTVSGNNASKMSLKAGEGVWVKVEAKDARTATVKTPVSKYIRLECIDPANVATDVTITGMDAEMQLTVGASCTPALDVAAKEEGKIVVDKTAVKLATSNKNVVAVKNGVLTAKKEGIATITATYGDSKVESTVYVGRNTAAVEKEFETIITNKMKSENYDYLGVKTKFDTKNNTFTLDITNPANDIRNIEGTGLVAFAKEVYASKQDTVGCNSITVTVDGTTWTAENAGNGLGNVYRNEELVLTDAGMTAAIDYVMNEVLAEAALLKDWNGKNFEIVFDVTDTRTEANKAFAHTIKYNVVTSMDSKLYEGTVDAAIANAIDTLAIEGLTLAYNAADNSVEIVVMDGNKTVAEVDAASRAAVVDALEVVFADATTVTLNAKAGLLTETVTKTNNGASEEFINDMLNDYMAKLADANIVTLADLDGVVMTADVTYTVGAQDYTYTYTANAVLDISVYDAVADAAITKAVENSTIEYDESTNSMKAVFRPEQGEDLAFDSLKGMGYKTFIDAVIGNTDAVSALVITDEGTTSVAITDEDAADTLAILMALKGEAETIREMDGRTAIIKVVYASANGASQKTLAYNVAFEVVEEVVETPDVPVSGNDVPVSGNEVPETGDDTPVSGNDVPVSGNDVPVSGNDVPVSGNDVSVSSNDVAA